MRKQNLRLIIDLINVAVRGKGENVQRKRRFKKMTKLDIEITVVAYTTAIIDVFEHSEANAGDVRFAIT